MSTNLIKCSSCGILTHIDFAVDACWKCEHPFTAEQLAWIVAAKENDVLRTDANFDINNLPNAPEPKPTKVAPLSSTPEVGCNIIGAIIIFFSVIFLLSWCSNRPSGTSDADLKKEAAEAAEARRYGTHCLSGWDGSHSNVVEAVKATLRDPSSFEHVETRTSPVDQHGKHTLLMKYSAKNGFGGTNVGYAKASLDNNSCQISIEQIE